VSEVQEAGRLGRSDHRIKVIKMNAGMRKDEEKDPASDWRGQTGPG
jgi:hypothetical protein